MRGGYPHTSCGAAPATVNKDLRQIRAAFGYAVNAGLLRANPLLRWRGLMLRESEKRVRVVEENEFAQLLKVCDNRTLKAILEVAYRQGLCRDDLVNRRWAVVVLNLVRDLGGWSSVSVVERRYTGDVAQAYRQAMDLIGKAQSA